MSKNIDAYLKLEKEKLVTVNYIKFKMNIMKEGRCQKPLSGYYQFFNVTEHKAIIQKIKFSNYDQ